MKQSMNWNLTKHIQKMDFNGAFISWIEIYKTTHEYKTNSRIILLVKNRNPSMLLMKM